MSPKELSKESSSYHKPEKGITALLSFFMFGCIGMITRLVIGPVILLDHTGLLYQYGPFFVGFGLVFAVIAHCFPRAMSIVMMFFPSIGISS